MGCAYEINARYESEVIVVDIYQSLEKMVRDVEKGAYEVYSLVKLNEVEYDAKCYRTGSGAFAYPGVVRIDLMKKVVSSGK